MPEKTLIARVRADQDRPDLLVVASPVVGRIGGAPKAGHFLNALDVITSIRILGEIHTLRLPRDVQGRIVEVFVPNAVTPVAFDHALLRLDPKGAAAETGPGSAAGTRSGTEAEGFEGAITVTAPSEGIFYRRPSPEAPPFVERGALVSTGTVLGLVEVMKCFNQITYGGPGLPPSGEVLQVLVEDAVEVQFGQALFRVRPKTE
jgi:acetyl-CoA carboxylase biotin carboxyl carrier protein